MASAFSISCVSRPPFKPSVVVAEYAAILPEYGITTVYGDAYAKEWVIEAFALHGIRYVRYHLTKNEIYLNALPKINSRLFRLLDITRFQRDARSRARHHARRTRLDHAPRSHA